MTRLEVNENILPFVQDIFLLENDLDIIHTLPFYADGYPGILYSETNIPVILFPLDKELPNFFLYGQTIEPIELKVKGPYKMIVFLLYPFATRILLDINPREINDACYDLMQVKSVDTKTIAASLSKINTDEQVEVISNYILDLVKSSTSNIDNSIKLAVSTILKTKGTISISQLRNQLFITERTFERKFNKEVGVTPKQFAKIIQFNFSLDQIKESDYTNFTTVAYENGFTDQSHFIRSFKKYTGGTPKEILAKLS